VVTTVVGGNPFLSLFVCFFISFLFSYPLFPWWMVETAVLVVMVSGDDGDLGGNGERQ
jgi:hypothetical protein